MIFFAYSFRLLPEDVLKLAVRAAKMGAKPCLIWPMPKMVKGLSGFCGKLPRQTVKFERLALVAQS